MVAALGKIGLARMGGRESGSESASSPADRRQTRWRNRTQLHGRTSWHKGKMGEIGPTGIEGGRSDKRVDQHKQEGSGNGKASMMPDPAVRPKMLTGGGAEGTLTAMAPGRIRLTRE